MYVFTGLKLLKSRSSPLIRHEHKANTTQPHSRQQCLLVRLIGHLWSHSTNRIHPRRNCTHTNKRRVHLQPQPQTEWTHQSHIELHYGRSYIISAANHTQRKIYTICALLQQAINKITTENHEALDKEARSIYYNPSDDYDAYIRQQQTSTHGMPADNYSNIKDEKTLLRYMVQGIPNLPQFYKTALFMEGNPRATIGDFTIHFRNVILMQQQIQTGLYRPIFATKNPATYPIPR